MPDSPQIVVVGSHAPGLLIRVKRIPRAGETVIGWDFHEPKDGGKGSNQAIAAALLGGQISFVGCFGRDRIGADGERWMREVGVDTSHLRWHDTVTSGVGFILLDESGTPAMVTSMGANAEMTPEYIETSLETMRGAKVLLTQFEIPVSLALHAARAAARLGMVAIVNPAPAPDERISGLDSSAILVPNETEAHVMLGFPAGEPQDGPSMAAELRRQTGAGTVIVTLGEQGVAGCDSEGTWQVDPPRVEVVDTSGAGDVFCAALAVSLVRGHPLRDASRWACWAASLSVTRAGTIEAFPTRHEINQFFRT